MSRFRLTPPPWWATTDQDRPVSLVRRPRTIALRAFLIVVLVGPLLAMVGVNPGLNPSALADGGVRERPTLFQLSAGCTGLSRWAEPPADEVGTIPGIKGVFAWRLSPPMSGNFSQIPYTGVRLIRPGDTRLLTPQEAVGALYRGGTVLWYLPSGKPADLEDLFKAAPGMLKNHSDLMIAPWPVNPEKTWTKGRQFIFTKWRTTLVCTEFSEFVFNEFTQVPSVAPLTFTSWDVPAPAAAVRTLDVLAAEK